MKKNKVALIYDFDGTLSPKNMQEYDFIPQLEKTPKKFWAETRELSKKQNGDDILSYMNLMIKEANQKEIPIKRSSFKSFGKTVELFPGVAEWFDRMNEYGKFKNVKVEHYIVSSGLREMIEGTSIAKHFKKIYASGFMYDRHGVAYWPAIAINYTTKTQFLFRINKGILHEWDNAKINDYTPERDRPIPFANMIYLGDGTTDVPCMKLVKEQGGHSIAVYKYHTKEAKVKAMKLINYDRVNFIAPADYSEGKQIDTIVKSIINKIAADYEVNNLK